MMKTCQVYLARLYYTIAKCTCQEVLRKNIKSKAICPRSITERGHNFYFITREAFSQSIFKVVSGSISPPMISRASSVSILDWMKRLSGLAP